MKPRAFLLILAVALFTVNLAAQIPGFAKDPAISPDGSKVCFVFDDDLWIVPFAGGAAQRLTNTDAVEYSPIWSPDGKWIAFQSNREGRSYPHLISPNGGEAQVIIRESYAIRDWYNDSKHLLVVRGGFEWGSSFYKLPIDGSRGTLIGEFADAFASLSPDNKSIVFSRYGNAHREAYTGSLNGDLYSFEIANKKYKQLTKTKYSERYPRFSHSTNALYYCYSDGKHFQLYKVDKLNFSRPQKLSELKDFSARDLSIARSNDRIVFEHFDEIYKYDPLSKSKNKVQKLDIRINEDMWQYSSRRSKMKDSINDFSISDNGLLVSYNYMYDTFLVPRKGGISRQLTFDHSGWSGMKFIGNQSLLLAKTEAGIRQLFTVEIDSSLALKPLPWFGAGKYSVDRIRKDARGRWQIFYSDDYKIGNVAVADSGFVNLRAIETPWAVSSEFCINDGASHAVYSSVRDDNYMREVYLYDFNKATNQRLFTDESWCANFTWSADERSILYSRGQDLYRLDLLPRDEFEYEKDYWQEVFDSLGAGEDELIEDEHVIIFEGSSQPEPEAEPVPESIKKLEIEWEGLDKRRHKLYTASSGYLWVLDTISDSTFLFVEQPNRRDNADLIIKKGDIYGRESKVEMNLGKDISNVQIYGKRLYYQQNEQLKSYGWLDGKKQEIPIALDYEYDTHELNKRVFEEAWGAFKENFYDPEMHGLSWQNQYQKYRPYADKARNINDIGTIVDEMIGDLNASHTGFYPREDNERIPYKSLGYLGMDLDFSQLLPEGIKIHRVYPTTRLHYLYKVQAGDILTHIDGHKITRFSPIDSLLIGKEGKNIKLKIDGKAGKIDAQITGLGYAQARKLWYDFKCARNREKVEDLSNGRLGYIHIPSMGEENYDQFFLDVFRDNHDKEALVLDFRGNTGGRIHDKIIQLLIKDAYAYSHSRRFSINPHPEPLRGIRVPTIVLVDEHSFSDGEIFPIVYQELKLGKVVGYPSSGAVIGTWQYQLLDGSEMRMPGSGWYKLDGSNMEGVGANPDILVENSLNDRLLNKDNQLERAVKELLKELK